jgi:hypothetical protein
MKSSLHSLMSFLPFVVNYSANCQFRRLNQILFCNCHLFSLNFAELNSRLYLNSSCVRSSYIALGRTTENTAFSMVACWFAATEICLPHSCVVIQPLHINACTHNVPWHLLYYYVQALPSNDCFSASTVLALDKRHNINKYLCRIWWKTEQILVSVSS